MDAVRTSLVARGSQMLLLLNPPFDRSAQDPGYIKGYPPGVRENGGQYTHAAVWVVMALARLGSGDEAAEFFHMLNPVNHGRTRGRRGALQDRAVRDGRRRLRAAAARRARRLELVHRLGRLDVSRRPREHSRPAPARRRRSSSTRAFPSSWPEYRIVVAVPRQPLRDHRVQPRAPVPRCRDGHARRRAGRSGRHPADQRRPDPRGADRARRSRTTDSPIVSASRRRQSVHEGVCKKSTAVRGTGALQFSGSEGCENDSGRGRIGSPWRWLGPCQSRARTRQSAAAAESPPSARPTTATRAGRVDRCFATERRGIRKRCSPPARSFYRPYTANSFLGRFTYLW